VSDSTRADRIRKLLALEIDRLLDDLERRRDFLIEVWGHHRARAPFLETVFHRWSSLGFPDLVMLEVDEVAIVSAFYRELEDLRIYLSHTQDMPRALALRYDRAFVRLSRLGEEALAALGGAPSPPMVPLGDAGAWFGQVLEGEE